MKSEPTDTTEPWGIIVTDKLHLSYKFGDPVCDDEHVIAKLDARLTAIADLRQDVQPTFGYADGRTVCINCIRKARQRAARYERDAHEAEAWNASKEQ